jgi:hypothetical protein
VNMRAVPYGGPELARLYDADGRPAATIASSAPGGFGVVVRDHDNRKLLTSQKAFTTRSVKQPPIRLTDAPRGRGRLASFPRHAYAATFSRLACVATVRKKGLSIRTQHVFLPTFIETSWVVRSARGRRLRIDAIMPSRWRQAKIDAVLHDGSRVPLVVHARPHGKVALAHVAYFHVQSLKSGYVVVVRKAPARATAFAIQTHPTGFESHAGPSLAIRLSNLSVVRSRTLVTAIAPARSAAEADAVAKQLGA